jgi:hypothetical protein
VRQLILSPVLRVIRKLPPATRRDHIPPSGLSVFRKKVREGWEVGEILHALRLGQWSVIGPRRSARNNVIKDARPIDHVLDSRAVPGGTVPVLLRMYDVIFSTISQVRGTSTGTEKSLKILPIGTGQDVRALRLHTYGNNV